MLFKNIAHVGSFKHFVFVYLRICVIVYLCILHLIHGNVIFNILESHAFQKYVRYIFNLGPARPPWYKEYMRSWLQHFTGIFRAVKRGGRLPLSMASNCPCLKVCPALLLRSPMALPSIFRAAKKAGQLSVYGHQLPSMTLSPASPNCNKGFAPSSAHKRLPLVLHHQAS